MRLLNQFFKCILIIFITSCNSTKKIPLERFIYCDYIGQNNLNIQEIENEVKNPTSQNFLVDSLIDKIIGLTFPYKGFSLIEDVDNKVDVAKAVIDRRSGFRYIIYNKNKIQNINLNSPESVAATLGVLAHEIGHLTFGHNESNYEFELLADRFSGWILKKLGVSRGSCTSALEKYLPQESINGSASHPPKSRRMEAMLLGWDMADTNINSKVQSDVRVVFYLESPDNPIKLTGVLSFMIGSKKTSQQINNESSVIFNNLSTDFLNKAIYLTLEDSKYIIDTSNFKKIELENDKTIFIKVLFNRAYAKPEESRIDLFFIKGSTIDFIQKPNDKLLSITLSAYSRSNYIIPISQKAKLQIGSSLFIDLKSTSTIYLEPNNVNEIYFEGFIPTNLLSKHLTGSAGKITIIYDNIHLKSDTSWSTDFEFSSETILEY